MKIKVFTLILFFALASTATAKEPYFVKTGSQILYYERYDADSKKLMQTTTLDICDVEKDSKSTRVNYGMLLKKANGQPMLGGRAPLTAVIEKNGDVWMDLGGIVKCVLQNMFPKAKPKAKGGMAIMPAVMHPGDTLPEAHCTVTMGPVKITVDVMSRFVLRQETLTTPAGTFKCIVAREHKVENAPLHHDDTWSDTWYAPGIGYVRHDSYNYKMELLSSEILVSIASSPASQAAENPGSDQ